jgi:hypothetical protein
MAQRAMNCRAMSICIPEYIILFDNLIAAIFATIHPASQVRECRWHPASRTAAKLATSCYTERPRLTTSQQLKK